MKINININHYLYLLYLINNMADNTKDNWYDSSESESDEIIDAVPISPQIIDENDDGSNGDPQVGSKKQHNPDAAANEDWEEYHGTAVCQLCGKANEDRIILSHSRKVICFNDCTNVLGGGEDDYDEDDYEDELDQYDKKLGRYVAFR